MSDTYTIDLDCSNCLINNQPIDIPRGQEVKDRIKVQECPICGCMTLNRKENNIKTISGSGGSGFYPQYGNGSITLCATDTGYAGSGTNTTF